MKDDMLAAINSVFAVLFLSASPVFAASPCPDNYRPYSFQGTVAESGATADGRPFYVIVNITNPACGDERQRIRAFPLAAAAACAVGASVRASGTYTKSCVNTAKGPVCLVQVGLRDSKGAIDTTKGAVVVCK
jgi:hypothetical protein